MIILEKLIFKLLGFEKIENKLMRCQNYVPDSIPVWKKQTNFGWKLAYKLLDRVEVFDGQKIRNVIHDIVESNRTLFAQDNLYVTSFGSEGKSGSKIAYEFRHTRLIHTEKFINAWDLTKLPEKSTVIFVEDLIGTGSQSTEYILEKLNLILNPSTDPYLLTICATPEGIFKVEDETNFKVLNGITLNKENYQHYTSESNYFNTEEKEKIIQINNTLKIIGRPDYDKGLLVTFYYSPPNNSMPILWKHNFLYKDNSNKEKKWMALLPRDY